MLPPKLPTHRDIYALGDGRNRVKIGLSNDVHKRRTNLQTGNADTLHLIYAEKVERSIATKVERGARKRLADDGKTGTREWLNEVSDDEAIDAIRGSHDTERGRNYK